MMLKKGLAVAVILLFIGMCVVPSTAVQELRDASTVSFDGNTLYVGGNGTGNYTTIQSAIDDAVDGDTVFVYDDSSPYYEIIDINKMIDVVGEDKNTTIIDGGGAWMVVNITKEKATLQDFYIQEGSYGIYIKVSDSIVCDNNLYNVLTGISVGSDSSGSHIKNNVISSGDVGIDISGDRNIITGNLITAHTYGGIYLSFCKYNIISENTVINNGMTDLFSGDIQLGGSSGTIISNNTLISLDKEYHYGIKLEGKFLSINNIIENNIISGHDTGIFLYNSLLNTIHYNDISECDEGIILKLSNLNKIKNNNFNNNSDNNARFFLFSLLNTWDSNFWDEPRDFPYIIIGRIFLLVIPWFNFDWNPAQEPYDIGV